jgi:hypothetical protein
LFLPLRRELRLRSPLSRPLDFDIREGLLDRRRSSLSPTLRRALPAFLSAGLSSVDEIWPTWPRKLSSLFGLTKCASSRFKALDDLSVGLLRLSMAFVKKWVK